ncbi:MAG: LysR family transcriptional regulator [Burkholderiaceae bacterium]
MNRKTKPQGKSAAAGAAGRSSTGTDRLSGLDLHIADLQILIRVAELGTLSAAAQERNVPVSQISRAITRLESGFKVRLVNRSTHGLSVTPEGELFLGHARRMVETLDDLSAELDTRSRSVSGLVRLSVSQVMGHLQVIPSMPELLEKYPELRIEIVANDSMVDLSTEGVDIALRTSMLVNENLVARELGEYGRAVYASPRYLEMFGTPDTPDELRGHRCITLSSINALNKWRFKVGRRFTEISIDGFHRVNSTAMAMSMVQSGLGLARLNTSLVGPALEAGEIVKVLADFQDPTRFPIYGVMLPDRHRLPKTRACLEHFQRLFANIKND